MTSKSVLGEKAVKQFLEGYNCAQSVLLTIFEHWDIRNDLVPKIATGFGGGIGRCGSVCGALAGGVMAISVKYGTNEPSPEKRLKTYALANEFYKKFEKQHGSVLCRELIGYNLSNPKELKKAQQSKVFEKKCVNFVRTVVETLIELDAHAE